METITITIQHTKVEELKGIVLSKLSPEHSNVKIEKKIISRQKAIELVDFEHDECAVNYIKQLPIIPQKTCLDYVFIYEKTDDSPSENIVKDEIDIQIKDINVDSLYKLIKDTVQISYLYEIDTYINQQYKKNIVDYLKEFNLKEQSIAFMKYYDKGHERRYIIFEGSDTDHVLSNIYTWFAEIEQLTNYPEAFDLVFMIDKGKLYTGSLSYYFNIKEVKV